MKRGLVAEPDQWKWSSFRSYAYGEPSLVRINGQEWPLQIKYRPTREVAYDGEFLPLIRKRRE